MMRMRSPGRDVLVSGVSSIASTENRLWRIFGCFALFWRGLALPFGTAEATGALERVAEGSVHEGPVSQASARDRYADRGHGQRAPDETAEVGTPSMDAAGSAHVTRRRAGMASTALVTDTTTMIRSRSTWSICGWPRTDPSTA